MDGYVTIEASIDTKEFDSQITYIESRMLDIEEKLKQADMGFEVGDTQKLEAEYEKLGNQLLNLKQKQEKYNQSIREASSTGLTNIQNQLGKIGNSIENVTKKAVRWGLAIFGIRSAYMFIRQSMSTLSEYNDELANKISNIRLVLATALEPVINRIISLVITLLNYLNYLTKAWFGLDLFSRASELSSKKMADNLKSGSKSAKEIKNQLAGFDEMNVLQENSSASGGGAGGVDTSKFDIPDVKIPDWLVWIKDHGMEIVSILAGIGTALVLLKLGLSPLMALGIGIAIAGIVYTIMALLKYLNDPSWKNFGKIIQGIGITLIGIGIAIGSLPLIVIGAVVLIVGTIIKYWEQIKAKLQEGIDWLTGKGDAVRKKFGDTIGDLYDFFVRELQRGLDFFDLTFKSIKGIFDGIIKFIKGVFKGDWKMAWEGIKDIFSNIWNWISGTAKIILSGLIDRAKTIVSTIGNVIGSVFKAVVNGVLNAIESILNSPIRAINSLISIVNKVSPVKIGKLSTFSLPRLAKGGIINQPGRGVMVGSAIAGEKGQEGVIPLTDSQQMELLGEAIGKYITINANITNSMNGRVISRELQKIQNESNFAFNG